MRPKESSWVFARKSSKNCQFLDEGQAAAMERSTPVPTPSSASSTAPVEPPKPKHPRGEMDPMAYIDKVLSENRVVLFMKGSPSQPLCGFSANAAGF